MTVLQLVNEKNPTSVRPTVEYIFYKATLGEIPRDVVERNKKKNDLKKMAYDILQA